MNGRNGHSGHPNLPNLLFDHYMGDPPPPWNYTYDRITGRVPQPPLGAYAPNVPVPYCDPCVAGLYPQSATCSCTACMRRTRQGVGQLPPPSSESEQAQVAGQLQERMVVIGVLAALAAAAVIYQTRKAR